MSKFKEGIEVLTKDKSTRLITIAGFCRKFADMILGSYAPFFFMLKYPTYKVTFAMLNAVSLASLGFCSNMINGIVGDRLSKKYPAIKQ